MPRRILPRVILLSIGFVLCLYSIRFLNTQGIEKTALKHLLLMEEGGKLGRWDWCEPGIFEIKYIHLLKPERSWQISSADLSGNQGEQWLKQHCRIEVQLEPDTQKFTLVDSKLLIQFVDDSNISIDLASGSDYFRWENKIYKSKQWLDALHNLAENISK